jgi:hypothetical protein
MAAVSATHETNMPIELLYIVPILALAALVFLFVLNAQKRSEAANIPQAGPV